MSEVAFIVLARAIHVMSGVTWAGTAFVLAALHPHDNSAGGLGLESGATAALLSLAVGLLIARPAGLELARLHASRDDAASRGAIRQVSRLRTRTVVSARVAAALLAVAVLAMAVFRYAAVVG